MTAFLYPAPDTLYVSFYLPVMTILSGLRLLLLLLSPNIGLRGLPDFLEIDVPFDYNFNKKSGNGIDEELLSNIGD